jgi:hypothetical protein
VPRQTSIPIALIRTSPAAPQRLWEELSQADGLTAEQLRPPSSPGDAQLQRSELQLIDWARYEIPVCAWWGAEQIVSGQGAERD